MSRESPRIPWHGMVCSVPSWRLGSPWPSSIPAHSIASPRARAPSRRWTHRARRHGEGLLGRPGGVRRGSEGGGCSACWLGGSMNVLPPGRAVGVGGHHLGECLGRRAEILTWQHGRCKQCHVVVVAGTLVMPSKRSLEDGCPSHRAAPLQAASVPQTAARASFSSGRSSPASTARSNERNSPVSASMVKPRISRPVLTATTWAAAGRPPCGLVVISRLSPGGTTAGRVTRSPKPPVCRPRPARGRC